MEKRYVARRQGEGGNHHLRPLLALAFLIGAVLCSNAWADSGRHGHGPGFYGHAHHGHGFHGRRAHLGVAIGVPLYSRGPGWYGDPYYAYPYSYRYRPLPLQIEAPPVYVERGIAPVTALWYFCSNPEGYYPYVKQCATGWRAVTPQSVVP